MRCATLLSVATTDPATPGRQPGHGPPSPLQVGQQVVQALGAVSSDLVALPFRTVAPLLEPVRLTIDSSLRRAIGAPAPSTLGAPDRRSRDGNGHAPSRSRTRRQASDQVPVLPLDAVARRVHGDLASMMIGGMAALLLQTLHPLAMAGVAEHSGYADDPVGRLRRTASFVGATTFGSAAEAGDAIRRVRAVHSSIRGCAPDGRPYSADDPELLTWVHAAEMASFLAACRRYGTVQLAPGDADRYLMETSVVALRLGAEWVPRSEAELDAYFHRMRPHLYGGAQALAARDFLLRGVGRHPQQRAVHACIAAAGVGLLPGWARHALQLPTPPLLDRAVVVPAARSLCHTIRWAVRTPGG